MSKAEMYLNDRIILLSEERTELLTKMEEVDLEIRETENKIKALQDSIDDAFEVFSPRTKKNDFIKCEIESLNKKILVLRNLRDDYEEKTKKLLEDINIIKDALGKNNDEKGTEIFDENVVDNDIDDASENNMINDVGSEAINNEISSGEAMEKLVVEKERLLIAGKIEEKTLQSVSNLIHKCDICGKVIEVDIGRAKLELEMMNKNLSELYNNIKELTIELRKTKNDDDGINNGYDKIKESDKKISVKKLSMNNLSNGQLLKNVRNED